GIFDLPVVTSSPEYISPSRARKLLERHGTWLQANTIVYRRNLLVETGGYLPELGPLSDGFIAQVLALSHGSCFIPEPLGTWRQMPNSYARAMTEEQRNYIASMFHLATTTYAGLFPRSYISRWRKDLLFQYE